MVLLGQPPVRRLDLLDVSLRRYAQEPGWVIIITSHTCYMFLATDFALQTWITDDSISNRVLVLNSNRHINWTATRFSEFADMNYDSERYR